MAIGRLLALVDQCSAITFPRAFYEGCTVLRWARIAYSRCRERTEADGDDRIPANPVARHEVLRALRPQGLRALPGVPRRCRQGLLPELQRVRVERLHAVGGRQEARADGERHPRLEDHIRRHRPHVEHRPAFEGDRAVRAPRDRVSRELQRRPDESAAAGAARTLPQPARGRQLRERQAAIELSRRHQRPERPRHRDRRHDRRRRCGSTAATSSSSARSSTTSTRARSWSTSPSTGCWTRGA